MTPQQNGQSLLTGNKQPSPNGFHLNTKLQDISKLRTTIRVYTTVVEKTGNLQRCQGGFYNLIRGFLSAMNNVMEDKI